MNLEIQNYPIIEDILEKSQNFIDFWTLANNFLNDQVDWLALAIGKIKYEKIERKMEQYVRQTLELEKKLEVIIDGKNTYNANLKLRKMIQEFTEKMWLLEILSSEHVREKKNVFLNEIGVKLKVKDFDI